MKWRKTRSMKEEMERGNDDVNNAEKEKGGERILM